MVDQYDGKSSEVCTSPPVKEQYSGLVSCTVHYGMFEGISHKGITEVKLPGSRDNHKGTRGFSGFFFQISRYLQRLIKKFRNKKYSGFMKLISA